MHKNRIDALLQRLKANNLDGLLITKPENIFYLTSFSADKMALLVSPKKLFAITDFIYAEAASKSLKCFEIFITKDRFSKTLGNGIKKYKIKKLGFESLWLSCYSYRNIKRGLTKATDFIATGNIVESLREIKEKGEISLLKKALKITAEALTDLKKMLSPAATELSAVRCIKEAFIKKGAQGHSFEPIVATQPSASQPHYAATSKRLGNNKAILVDLGARLDGYNSDLTRICTLGKINSKFVKLYNILLDAQKHAIDRVRPGAKISHVDSAARQHIESKGLGEFFGHALGHGLGLETHEKPSISAGNNDILKENMVFTIEPGIYIPGLGGLRIEDTVRVGSKGCEVLSRDIGKSI